MGCVHSREKQSVEGPAIGDIPQKRICITTTCDAASALETDQNPLIEIDEPQTNVEAAQIVETEFIASCSNVTVTLANSPVSPKPLGANAFEADMDPTAQMFLRSLTDLEDIQQPQPLKGDIENLSDSGTWEDPEHESFESNISGSVVPKSDEALHNRFGASKVSINSDEFFTPFVSDDAYISPILGIAQPQGRGHRLADSKCTTAPSSNEPIIKNLSPPKEFDKGEPVLHRPPQDHTQNIFFTRTGVVAQNNSGRQQPQPQVQGGIFSFLMSACSEPTVPSGIKYS